MAEYVTVDDFAGLGRGGGQFSLAIPDFRTWTSESRSKLVKRWIASGFVPAEKEDWFFETISLTPPEQWSASERATIEAAWRGQKPKAPE